MVAIDLLSRTVYGEMASCNRHGSVYLNAVSKVVLNRVTYAAGFLQLAAKQSGKSAKLSRAKANEFYEAKFENVGGEFGPVVLKPYAFSLWNKGDPAGENAFCPANPKDKKAGKNPAALKAYKAALKAAIKAVKFPAQLNKEMAAIKQHFYTSTIAMPKKHAYKETVKVNSELGTMDRKECMRLWTSKRIQSHRDQLVRAGQLTALLKGTCFLFRDAVSQCPQIHLAAR